jgi:hypothetical protein
MSSRSGKKNPSSAAPKSRKRPYDNRPRSSPAPAKQHTPKAAEAIRVNLPDELTLTPEAAWALLKILIKAHDRRNTEGADQ